MSRLNQHGMDYWEVLGVTLDSSLEEIQSAYQNTFEKIENSLDRGSSIYSPTDLIVVTTAYLKLSRGLVSENKDFIEWKNAKISAFSDLYKKCDANSMLSAWGMENELLLYSLCSIVSYLRMLQIINLEEPKKFVKSRRIS